MVASLIFLCVRNPCGPSPQIGPAILQIDMAWENQIPPDLQLSCPDKGLLALPMFLSVNRPKEIQKNRKSPHCTRCRHDVFGESCKVSARICQKSCAQAVVARMKAVCVQRRGLFHKEASSRQLHSSRQGVSVSWLTRFAAGLGQN